MSQTAFEGRTSIVSKGWRNMKKEGVLIIGHGSKLNFNKDVMEYHAGRLKTRGFSVYIGFNENSSPSIEEALETMADDGIETIYALPLFIASGTHLTKDLPEKLGIPGDSTGGDIMINGRSIRMNYATPIGNDPRVTDILVEKINGFK